MDNHQVKVAVTLGLVVASSTIIGIELDSSWLGIAAFLSHTVIMVGWRIQ